MANSELEALRQQARLRHRAATRKVSRLHQSQGVELSGTEADPRRELSKIKRYNSKQLESYISQLDQFTSRRTQYVPDAHGRPVDRAEFRKFYKDVEDSLRRKANESFSRVAKLKLPHGATLEENRAKMTPTHPTMANTPNHTIYDVPDRGPENFESAAQMKKLGKKLKKRLTPAYERYRRKAAKTAMDKMIRDLNSPDIEKLASQLTPAQRDVLWNGTTFAQQLSQGYANRQLLMKDSETAWASEPIRNAMEEIKENLEWAINLKANG